MKAISFLGAGPALETTYHLPDGREHTAPFFPAALVRFYPVDTLLVFVTTGARTMHFEHLRTLAEDYVDSIVPLDIPDGRDEAELWQIFSRVADAVQPDDRVIFDITHGFRSLPFLSFLAAAYLRAVKRVTLEAVLYGALDAGDKSVKPARAPVFDLSRFVTLLDWLTATDQFTQTGDARRLAHLLNPTGAERGAAADASMALSTVSLAAFLCQPFRLMSEAVTLDDRLRAAERVYPNIPPPYELLRDRIVDTFGTFGANFQGDPKAGLAAQMRLIEWYYTNNQLIQAVTLAREWLINAVAYRLEGKIDLKPSARRTMERAVSGLSMVGREYRDDCTGETRVFSVEDLNQYGREIHDSWPERESLKQTWDNLSAVRNALDHAGHQDDAMKLERVTKKVKTKVIPDLRELAQKWLPDTDHP